MKLKGAIQYQLSSSLKSLGLFYGIMLLLRLIGIGMAFMGDGKMHMSGLELNSIIFMMMLGIYTFTEDFRFLLQNGYTRKSMMMSFLCEFITLAFAASILDITFEFFTAATLQYDSLFQQLYGNTSLILQFLWTFLIYLCTCSVSFLLVVVYHRLTKRQRMIYMLGLPIAVVVLVPVLNEQLLNGVLLRQLGTAITWMFGLKEQIMLSISILIFTALNLIFGVIVYACTRRLPLR